jgi:hypothetical protein
VKRLWNKLKVSAESVEEKGREVNLTNKKAKLGNRSYEAMKRCDEVLNASISLPALNSPSLHCFNFLPELTFHRFPNLPSLP